MYGNIYLILLKNRLNQFETDSHMHHTNLTEKNNFLRLHDFVLIDDML